MPFHAIGIVFLCFRAEFVTPDSSLAIDGYVNVILIHTIASFLFILYQTRVQNNFGDHFFFCHDLFFNQLPAQSILIIPVTHLI